MGCPLRWDPEKEQFLGDEQANSLLSRPRRIGFELPEIVWEPSCDTMICPSDMDFSDDTEKSRCGDFDLRAIRVHILCKVPTAPQENYESRLH